MAPNKLTDLVTYERSKISFGEIKQEKVPQGPNEKGSPITFKRIPISAVTSDGTECDFIFKTPSTDHFCFGLKEGKFGGHTMGFTIYNRKNTKECEKIWCKKFDQLMDDCINAVIEAGAQGKLGSSMKKLNKNDFIFEKFNPLWWKTDEHGNKTEEENGPILNVKTWEKKSRKGDELISNILTIFEEKYRDGDGKMKTKRVNPIDLIGKRCTISAAIKLESIYIGGKNFAPQIKLYHVIAKTSDEGPVSILTVEDEDDEEEEKDTNEQQPEDKPEKTIEETMRETEEPISNSDDEKEQKTVVKKVKRKSAK